MKGHFTGKKAVIFGGSNGIGLATAELLAENSIDITIVGQNETKLKKTKHEFEKKGVSIHVFNANISELTSMKRVLQEIRDKFGKIDYLINAAGISISQKKGVLDIDAFTKLIDVNLKGVYLTSMLYGYKSMNKGGSIVNIASIRGRTGTDSFSQGYAAAKAGVINLTKTFATELASKNIRVNCVAPGPIYPTGLSETWPKSTREAIAKNIPLKRLGRPQEVANVIVFLLSEDSSYITGQTIDVNGGQWMN